MHPILPERLPSYKDLTDLTGELDPGTIAPLLSLYRQTVDNSSKEHEARAGHFHPSSVGYCKRANLYQYYRTPASDRRSKEFVEIVTLGHLVHDLLQGRLEKVVTDALERKRAYRNVAIEFQREVTYNPKTDVLFRDLNIGGTCDGLLRIKGRNWEQFGVIEIKSQNNDWFLRTTAQPIAHINHLMQAHLYAFRFNAPIIWVWYYNKNNSKHELKPQFFNHEIFAAAVQYFEELNAYAERRELPPREEDHFACKECLYRSICEPRVLSRKAQTPAQPLSKLRFRRK